MNDFLQLHLNNGYIAKVIGLPNLRGCRLSLPRNILADNKMEALDVSYTLLDDAVEVVLNHTPNEIEIKRIPSPPYIHKSLVALDIFVKVMIRKIPAQLLVTCDSDDEVLREGTIVSLMYVKLTDGEREKEKKLMSIVGDIIGRKDCEFQARTFDIEYGYELLSDLVKTGGI